MLNTEQLTAEMHKIIASGNLKKAFSTLKSALSEHQDSQIYQDLIFEESQFSANERKALGGLVTEAEQGLARRKTTNFLLELLKDLPSLNEPAPVSASITKTVILEDATPQNPVEINQTISIPSILNFITGKRKNVLFLASNPSDTARLQLDKEFRIVSKELQDEQDKFNLRQVFELTADKLHEAMMTEKPEVLHFSGHGLKTKIEEENMGGSLYSEIEKSGGIVLQNKSGTRHIVETDAIANLFELTMEDGGKIEVVLFNACYSEEQAQAINKFVPYVIGMNNAVEDGAALEFTTGFYRAISEGKSIEMAFKWAISKVKLEGYTGANIPVLHKRQQ